MNAISASTTPAQKHPSRALRVCRFTWPTVRAPAQEVAPPASPRKYWTRRGIAEWLVAKLCEGPATLVGIDHGFSFPIKYFEKSTVSADWPAFLDDFQQHWPTDEYIYVDFVRDGSDGNGAVRSGDPRWRRITEMRVRAKSVFHFDVQGSVAKSTHAGIPWLRYIRQNAKGCVDSGRLMGGAHHLAALWSQRFTLRCGAGLSQMAGEHQINKMLMPLLNGSNRPTGTEVLGASCTRNSNRMSKGWLRLRAGF